MRGRWVRLDRDPAQRVRAAAADAGLDPAELVSAAVSLYLRCRGACVIDAALADTPEDPYTRCRVRFAHGATRRTR